MTVLRQLKIGLVLESDDDKRAEKGQRLLKEEGNILDK